MQQAGFKPKPHTSGVYWTRATARTGRARQSTEKPEYTGSIKISEIPPFILAMIILLAPIYFVIKGIYLLTKNIIKTRG